MRKTSKQVKGLTLPALLCLAAIESALKPHIQMGSETILCPHISASSILIFQPKSKPCSYDVSLRVLSSLNAKCCGAVMRVCLRQQDCGNVTEDISLKLQEDGKRSAVQRL